MVAAYLWLNAVLYALFAAWCTVRWKSTSAAVGYLALDNGGRSEYLVVYGGLQAGLAIAFALLALRPEWHRAGVLFALCLYAPIVAYRVVTALAFAPVGATTWAVAGLESVLLAGAVALWLIRS